MIGIAKREERELREVASLVPQQPESPNIPRPMARTEKKGRKFGGLLLAPLLLSNEAKG